MNTQNQTNNVNWQAHHQNTPSLTLAGVKERQRLAKLKAWDAIHEQDKRARP